jgi:transforming growth factor-beta-induced protein
MALPRSARKKEIKVKKIGLGLILTLLLTASVGVSAQEMNIVDTAAAAGQFTTLLKALKAAGLEKTLEGPGPFTVFAPTDAAFAKLPPGTVANLLKPENRDKLRAILTYHVVAGNVTAAQVVHLDSAKTLNGQEIAIRVVDGSVRVNDARVVKADIHASNGVIHVIDTVLLPGGSN